MKSVCRTILLALGITLAGGSGWAQTAAPEPRATGASAPTDREIAASLRRQYSCPVLAPTGMVTGQVRGAAVPVQVFVYGAEGCPRLPFQGTSFAVAVRGHDGVQVIMPDRHLPGVQSAAIGRDGLVLVTTLEYGPDDPRCCPSRRSTHRYAVSGERLVRQP